MNIRTLIANHQNLKTLIFDILNENATFLYDVFSKMRIWNSPREAKINLRKIIEAYLLIQNNLNQNREPYKEFIMDQTAIYSAIDYLCKTIQSKNSIFLEATLIAIWITLERRELEFEEFYNVYINDGACDMEESLIAFFVFLGNG